MIKASRFISSHNSYLAIYEQETSVCMCYTITVKQKTQRLFDEFLYFFNT